MKMHQVKRLIKAFEIRWQQMEKQFNGEPLPYKIHDGHHMRDIRTALAVLRGESNAEDFLKNVPTEKDLIP